MANRDSKGSSKFVVVRQVWVKYGQTKAWFQAAGRVVVEGQTWVGAGRTKAWFQTVGRVVVGSRHRSEPGRRRRRQGSRADEDCSGEGTGTQTETGTDVDARTGTETENCLGANGLRRLERLGANTGVATVQTSQHNWTQWGFILGETGCA